MRFSLPAVATAAGAIHSVSLSFGTARRQAAVYNCHKINRVNMTAGEGR